MASAIHWHIPYSQGKGLKPRLAEGDQSQGQQPPVFFSVKEPSLYVLYQELGLYDGKNLPSRVGIRLR